MGSFVDNSIFKQHDNSDLLFFLFHLINFYAFIVVSHDRVIVRPNLTKNARLIK